MGLSLETEDVPMKNLNFRRLALAGVAVLGLAGCASSPDAPHPIRDRAIIDDPELKECFAETPIPRDAFSEELLASDDPFIGVWAGRWRRGVCHTLIVTPRAADGYNVIYSSGGSNETIPVVNNVIGRIKRSNLHLVDFAPQVVYTRRGDHSLEGYYFWPEKGWRARGTFRRIPLETLEASAGEVTG